MKTTLINGMVHVPYMFEKLGTIMMWIGVLLLPCGIIAYIDHHQDYQVFMIFCILQILSAFLFHALAKYLGKDNEVFHRDDVLVTLIVWCFVFPLIASWVFVFSSANLPFTSAFFETISGITTTGATMIANVEGVSRGVLLWRQILHFLGGVGIMCFVAIKFVPAIVKIPKSIVALYSAFVLFGAIGFVFLGNMHFFDAFSYAISSIVTGGFANYNDSFSHFDTASKIIAMVLMFLGSVSFFFLSFMFSKLGVMKELRISEDEKIQNKKRKKQQMEVVLFAIFVVFLAWMAYGTMKGYALIDVVFIVLSAMSTTGLVTIGIDAFSPVLNLCVMLGAILGGCSSSTAGGIRMSRLITFAKSVHYYILQKELNHDHTPQPGYGVSFGILLIPMYIFTWLIFGFLFALNGLNFQQGLMYSADLLSNTGMVTNFFQSGTNVVVLGGILMLVGRLEYFILLSIFYKAFWTGKKE